ncbi:MAG: glucoamylase family protein [Bacteroidota bacterium]
MILQHGKIRLITVLVLFVLSTNQLFSQVYLYFQDSPASDYYDYSWMDRTAPSVLEGLGTDQRKFPVETTTPAHQGLNCLRMTWKSVSGGNWYAIAAGSNWTEKDLSATDTMSFWLYSADGLAAAAFPLVFVEDITNKKSHMEDFGAYSADLQAGAWTRYKIPMDHFLTSGDGVNYTVIKTIGFAQNASDNVSHTLLVDDMRVYVGDGTFPPAVKPTGVSATGYDSHIEVAWKVEDTDNLAGFEIQKSTDGGSSFATVKLLDENQRYFVDWTRSQGYGYSAHYRVLSLNSANEASDPSETVSATTREFTDDELLDMVERYTFRFFWDYAQDSSGMTRDRNNMSVSVTSGGSGFGVMAIVVGIERGYITRQEGIDRMERILDFLEKADRFHGAWSHFIDGNSGAVVPFSTYDNGGDLVETAFLIEGLLTVRAYFDGETAEEQSIVSRITALYEAVEWDWYRKNNSNVLYWHWSPNYEWQINMQLRGWNETGITYMLAIASPTHSVPASLWQTGWAGASYYLNGDSFYGHKLWVGWDYGGPLFFTHYSFVGFDPRDKRDQYANYFDNNRNIALIHQAYSIQNPKNYTGYGANCWGLTASDDPDGYSVHEPTSTRDNGTITPTAALSSFPYTPEESMLALKHFYRDLGDKIWDWMGFKDAFNQKRNWYASSYLAIDQGPIILMIENYRTQLLWDLFMSNPEISPMLEAIGFHYSPNTTAQVEVTPEMSIFPNPAAGSFNIGFDVDEKVSVELSIYDINGKLVGNLCNGTVFAAGHHEISSGDLKLAPGVYFARLITDQSDVRTIKIIMQ